MDLQELRSGLVEERPEFATVLAGRAEKAQGPLNWSCLSTKLRSAF